MDHTTDGDRKPTRRRLLQYSGTAIASDLLAGCLGTSEETPTQTAAEVVNGEF